LGLLFGAGLLLGNHLLDLVGHTVQLGLHGADRDFIHGPAGGADSLIEARVLLFEFTELKAHQDRVKLKTALTFETCMMDHHQPPKIWYAPKDISSFLILGQSRLKDRRGLRPQRCQTAEVFKTSAV